MTPQSLSIADLKEAALLMLLFAIVSIVSIIPPTEPKNEEK